MSQQSSYSFTRKAGVAGFLPEPMQAEVKSAAASTAIPFGYALAWNSSLKEVKLPGTQAEVETSAFAGFAALETVKEANTSLGYLENDMVSVCTKGKIYAVTIDAVVFNAKVYVITSGSHRGKVTDNSGAAGDPFELPGATFRETTGAEGIALVEFCCAIPGLTGPQGEPGEQGPPGAPGEQGPPGAPG